jgi:hypothetical protein
VGAFDLTTGHVQILTQAHTPYSLADVAVSGDFVAWVRLYTVARGSLAPRMTSTLWLENMRTRRLREVDVHRGASELSMWGRNLVYKAAPTRYDQGDIYLYDIRKGSTQRITTQGFAWGVDSPSVGGSVITWSELARVRVGVYDLSARRILHPPPGDGGRAYTAGHLLLYVASHNGRNGANGFGLVIDQLR